MAKNPSYIHASHRLDVFTDESFWQRQKLSVSNKDQETVSFNLPPTPCFHIASTQLPRSHMCPQTGRTCAAPRLYSRITADERSVPTDESLVSRKTASIEIGIRGEEVARGRGLGFETRARASERGNNFAKVRNGNNDWVDWWFDHRARCYARCLRLIQNWLASVVGFLAPNYYMFFADVYRNSFEKIPS